MNPAFSVIFFTTLSGAGFGLWAWLGLRIALGAAPIDFQVLGWILLLIAGGIAAAVGLLASFWHLGKPLRAWRAFSQWRTSWLSREGVLAVASFLPAFALFLLLKDGAPGGISPAVRVASALLAVLSLGTVACTAMIYVSLKPIPAWRHRLVLPGYLLSALLTGGLPMLLSTAPNAPGLDGALPWVLVAITVMLMMLKIAYWRSIDRGQLAQSRGDAIGLPHRSATVFERPHTEANYITREMGFVLARRHVRTLRVMAAALFGILPVLLMAPMLISIQPDAAAFVPLAATSALAGTFVERWLFFAQAKHMVTLYY